MKKVFACFILAICLQATKKPAKQTHVSHVSPVHHLFIITIDGFRWQEVFNGADSLLLNNERYTPDTSTMKMMYWSSDVEERRKKLMPFFWNVLANKGQVYGNRYFNNRVDVSNIYSLSYPGYNEIFTGQTDMTISSNDKKINANRNVLEYLNQQKNFKGEVVAFTSWSELKMNSGYENMNEDNNTQSLLNKVEND